MPMRTEPGLVPEMLVFAKVVELRSFAAAARQLELTTSAVSRSVGRLEAHWGVQLPHHPLAVADRAGGRGLCRLQPAGACRQ